MTNCPTDIKIYNIVKCLPYKCIRIGIRYCAKTAISAMVGNQE